MHGKRARTCSPQAVILPEPSRANKLMLAQTGGLRARTIPCRAPIQRLRARTCVRPARTCVRPARTCVRPARTCVRPARTSLLRARMET
jgi:hypothetical protein